MPPTVALATAPIPHAVTIAITRPVRPLACHAERKAVVSFLGAYVTRIAVGDAFEACPSATRFSARATDWDNNYSIMGSPMRPSSTAP